MIESWQNVTKVVEDNRAINRASKAAPRAVRVVSKVVVRAAAVKVANSKPAPKATNSAIHKAVKAPEVVIRAAGKEAVNEEPCCKNLSKQLSMRAELALYFL